MGHGPGLSDRRLGSRSGSETNILNVTQMPSHNHLASAKLSLNAAANPADASNPTGNSLGVSNIYDSDDQPSRAMNEGSVTGSVTVNHNGGNQAINNMQPYLTINYIIALQGIYPSRS
jgi:microcystin-dependent protein